ncbi:MAG: SGNH/GDSL hydrolase family protein, partial [Nitrospiraceae bacterium]
MLNHTLQEAGIAISRRIGFAVIGLLGTAALYAEGILKDGLLEIPLLIPILWVMVSQSFGNREKGMMVVLSMACLTLVACDLLARPFAAPYLHYNPANMFSRKLPNLSILGRWDADVYYQGPAYGDLAAMKGEEKWREIRDQVFQTDSAGFRNATLHQPVDLILLGDSFTAGIGTSQDKLFSRLLEDRYGRSVYNMGYPGGPYDEYLNFAIESPKLDVSSHAEIVWVFYEGNDLDDPGGETWDLPALPWQSRIGAGLVRWRTFRNRSPINQIMESIRKRTQGDIGEVIVRALPDGRSFLFAGWQEVWGTRSQAEIEAHANFQRLGRTMEAMQRLATERHVGVSVLIMPTKGQVYRWVLDQRQPVPEDLQPSSFARSVLELCDRLHFRCFDLKAYLATEAIRMYRSSGELLWWRDDTHLGELGHEAMAAFISQHVLNSRSNSV